MSDDTPKIIVDDDWKEEARKEQEAADRETREMPKAGEIPAASFLEILQLLGMQATAGLGMMADPQTGQQIPPNLGVAKHFIDLLEILQTKTKGNLDEEEQKMLDGMVSELQMAFTQIVEAVGSASAEEQKPEAGDA
jgi:hypothetical protein